jgi:hypothetical protein
MGKCYLCKQKGHLSSECPNKDAAAATAASTTKPVAATSAPTTATGESKESKSSSKKGKGPGKCYKCKGKGHLASECPNEQPAATSAPTPSTSTVAAPAKKIASTSMESNDEKAAKAKKAGKCYKCKQKGHMASDCPSKYNNTRTIHIIISFLIICISME